MQLRRALSISGDHGFHGSLGLPKFGGLDAAKKMKDIRRFHGIKSHLFRRLPPPKNF